MRDDVDHHYNKYVYFITFKNAVYIITKYLPARLPAILLILTIVTRSLYDLQWLG